MVADVDDLRVLARASAALEQSLSAEETALTNAFRADTQERLAALRAVDREEEGEAGLAFTAKHSRLELEYVRQAGELHMRRVAAHAERCRLDTELEAAVAADLVAVARPQSA